MIIGCSFLGEAEPAKPLGQAHEHQADAQLGAEDHLLHRATFPEIDGGGGEGLLAFHVVGTVADMRKAGVDGDDASERDIMRVIGSGHD